MFSLLALWCAQELAIPLRGCCSWMFWNSVQSTAHSCFSGFLWREGTRLCFPRTLSAWPRRLAGASRIQALTKTLSARLACSRGGTGCLLSRLRAWSEGSHLLADCCAARSRKNGYSSFHSEGWRSALCLQHGFYKCLLLRNVEEVKGWSLNLGLIKAAFNSSNSESSVCLMWLHHRNYERYHGSNLSFLCYCDEEDLCFLLHSDQQWLSWQFQGCCWVHRDLVS